MTQKVSRIVGISNDSFADAAAKAIEAAKKTLRGMKWARIVEFEMELDDEKVKNYRATLDLYFDLEDR